MEQIHRAAHWGSGAMLTGHYLRADGKTTLCGKDATIAHGKLWTKNYVISGYPLDDGDCKKCIKLAATVA